MTEKRIKRGWMNLKVVRVEEDTHDTKTFFMHDADEGGRQFDYDAGQYLTFRFDDVGPKPLVRSYTMSSSPNQPDAVAFTVKRVEGGLISNWLCDNVKVGSILKARGSIGRFCYYPNVDQPWLLMVAGGSGVTPFVSIMREFAARTGQANAPQGMVLLVAYRSQEDLIQWEDLQKIASFPNCKVITTLTREDAQNNGFWHGRPDEKMLERAFGEHIKHATIMTCGPKAIMDIATAYGQAKGLPPAQIKTEAFD